MGHAAIIAGAGLLVLAAQPRPAAAQRPGPGNGYDPGVALQSVVSPEERFRVWYVTESGDAVAAADLDPADGVPDFAAEVAAVAEQSHQAFVVEGGFRAPAVDTEILPAEQVGGDERFDIYLMDFGKADGSHDIDACDSDGDRCASHILMENDFQETSYPSTAIAIRVVTSHEYFHAIQAAYGPGQDIKWTEGTAVWAEEQAFPEQDDYEAFLPHFLAKPHWAFDLPGGGGFGDLQPYGAALWPTFLSRRYDADIVRRIWEACADGTDFLAAADQVLQADHATTLAQAWREFTWWNLFTAERADESRAYAGADTWPSVALEAPVSGPAFAASYAIEGLSARYVPISLADAGGTPHTLRMVTESGAPVSGTAFLWDGSGLSEPMHLMPDADDPNQATLALTWQGTPTLFVVLTGHTRGASVRLVQLSMSDDGGGCQIAPAQSASRGSRGTMLVCLLAAVALLVMRRGHRGRLARALLVLALGAGVWLAHGPHAHAQPEQGPADTSDTPAEPAADPPMDLAQEEVIVMTGSRAERPLAESTVATEVISRRDIEASGATNLAEVLEEHPGMDIAPALRGSSIRMQGLDSTYVAVLVDGQRRIGRLDGAIDLEGIPVRDIERIEIVKGPSSALYGSDALAGVINIITRKPEKRLEGDIEAVYGYLGSPAGDSLGNLDLSAGVGFRARASQGRVSAGWHRGDGYDLSPGDVATTADAFDHKQVAARFAHNRGRLELSTTAEYLLRRLQGVDVRGGGAVFDHENAIENASASLAAKWRSARGLALTTSLRYALYRDQRLDDQRDATAMDTYEETDERLAEVLTQVDGTLGQRHAITAGIEGARESLDGARIREDAHERYRIAAFAQDEWNLSSASRISLAVGGRLDVDTQFGVHATPRIALRWDPHQRVITRASYGWGYRAPSFKELYLAFDNAGVGYRVDGNPDLAPETSQSVQTGVEARIHDRAWALANLYYNDIEDLITIDLVEGGGPDTPDRFGYVNAESAYTRGLESAIRIEPGYGVTAKLGYSFTDTRDRAAGRALPGRARHRGTLELGYAHGGSRATARARLVGRRAFFRDGEDPGTYETVMADAHATVDLRLAHTLRQRVTLFAGVDNLLDAGEPTYLPIAPRSVYAGASATY